MSVREVIMPASFSESNESYHFGSKAGGRSVRYMYRAQLTSCHEMDHKWTPCREQSQPVANRFHARSVSSIDESVRVPCEETHGRPFATPFPFLFNLKRNKTGRVVPYLMKGPQGQWVGLSCRGVNDTHKWTDKRTRLT